MMLKRLNRFIVLMAEDDPDDRFLVERAFRDIQGSGDLRFVEDGEALVNYLFRSGQYADPELFPRPSLILLDLNMPKKDGRQALIEIKRDPELQAIPVVVWTTSNESDDRIQCKKIGAASYVTKPIAYAELVRAIRELVSKYSPKNTSSEKI